MTDKITYIENFLINHEVTRNLQYGVMLRMSFQGKSYADMDDRRTSRMPKPPMNR
jgi:hypothetical protein